MYRWTVKMTLRRTKSTVIILDVVAENYGAAQESAIKQTDLTFSDIASWNIKRGNALITFPSTEK